MNKTIQQLSEERYPVIPDDYEYPGSAVTDIQRKAFISGYRTALEGQWVSVEDGLPEIDQQVAVVLDYGDRKEVTATKWSKGEEKYYKMNCITHWMPLPQPPKQ